MKRQQITSFLIIFLVGFTIWFMPKPNDLEAEAWHLFAIFFATILGVILKPLPIGAMSILAMAVVTGTKTLDLQVALGGFQNSIAWLVVFAFFISRGFIKTGLGDRIAYYFVSIFGKRTLGLSYSLLASEFILAPAIPSVTARTGGVIFPVVKGLALSFGSTPDDGTERRIGSFLMKVAYQGSVISSAMFLTAMAANPFFAGLTEQAGFTITWGMWALAAIVPGILSLIVMPLIVYKLYPPSIKNTPHAADFARKKLAEKGQLHKKEWLMLVVFVALVTLWILGGVIHMSATLAALLGLALLLVLRVLDWKDVTGESNAWDTFIWFSTLIMLATSLSTLGFTPWFSEQIVELVGGLQWQIAFGVLFLIYFYSHYFFASNTAHVGALYPSFLMVAVGLGVPPALAILVFAFSSNLFGGLTQYGSGPAPLYYGSGYIDIKDWWRLGFVISVFNILIWIGLGSLWWKLLGMW